MTTFKSLDIKKMGCFDGFEWNSIPNDSKSNPTEFRYLNIIYGRNYSGKTTISRIFRALETHKAPANYKDIDFTLKTDSDSYNPINYHEASIDIRVYNKDFVDQHLGFLRDHNNDVLPFAVVGGVNVEVTEKINEKEKQLGDKDKIETLLGKLHLAEQESKKENQAYRKKDGELNTKLSNKATDRRHGIKYAEVFGDPTYDIRKIQRDIDLVGSDTEKYIVDESAFPELLRQAQEQPLNVISGLRISIPDINPQLEVSKELVERKIQTSQPIMDLLDDSLLQAWVKQGRELHEGKRKKCGFCNNDLPESLWDDLGAHFNKESQKLESDIDGQLAKLESMKLDFQRIGLPSKERFYEVNKAKSEELLEKIKSEVEIYNKAIDELKTILVRRKSSIFDSIRFPEITKNTEEIRKIIEEVDKLIISNNEHTSSIDRSKSEAKRKLILNEVARFYADIDYPEFVKQIGTLKEVKEKSKQDEDAARELVNKQEKEIERLKHQLKDESQGADKVNEYLSHHFGHSGIRLEAVEGTDSEGYEGKAIKFKILRGSEPAYNLSEGECSIIAFCYFMAKLEEPQTSGKKLIVYIDDPISSLDANHIFFIYSLISSQLSRSLGKDADGKRIFKHDQLFISTHNLEFLKYLKKLDAPKKGVEFFIVEGGESKSVIKRMPDYLRKYNTEFNYLFEQIYKCSTADQSAQHEIFYNFGNNLRKFLEAYLFYRYPFHEDGSDHNTRIRMFFGDDHQAGDISTRISNELSHLEEIFDRSMKPIEIPEIPKLANFILDKMFEKDADQFNALLKSIGEPERVMENS